MRKVTKAMQMVSAAKMRKAQTAVVNSRTYAGLAWELVGNLMPAASPGVIPEDLSASENLSGIQKDGLDLDPGSRMHSAGMTQVLSLLRQFPNAKKVGVIVLSTNRGLVGSLNSNLIKVIQDVVRPFMGSQDADKSAHYDMIAELIVYGKKAKVIAQRMGKNIMADFNKLDKTITTEDIFPLAKLITDSYLSGQYKKIVIIYNHFVSTAVQKPTMKQLLPFATSSVIARSATDEAISSSDKKIASDALAMTDYLFEPDPTQVLEHLLPRIIESQLYQTILESDASEHSARMIMMKNATDAAGDLVGDLTLTYNRLRQGKITTELAEITAGRIALE